MGPTCTWLLLQMSLYCKVNNCVLYNVGLFFCVVIPRRPEHAMR